jgi:hypothetical protein
MSPSSAHAAFCRYHLSRFRMLADCSAVCRHLMPNSPHGWLLCHRIGLVALLSLSLSPLVCRCTTPSSPSSLCCRQPSSLCCCCRSSATAWRPPLFVWLAAESECEGGAAAEAALPKSLGLFLCWCSTIGLRIHLNIVMLHNNSWPLKEQIIYLLFIMYVSIITKYRYHT